MFSIIVPLYNKAEYVADTIESALKQTYSDFELVIVNDGSTDNSAEIVTSFKDPRIKFYTKENGGVSSARNYGMERASKNYIAFLDADDSWENNYLEAMRNLILKYPNCGMYSSAYKVIYPNKEESECNNLPEGIVEDYFKVVTKHIITWTSATIIKKEVFNDLGGFPVGMVAGQDTYMWAKIATKYKVAFTPQVLASYNYIFTGINLRKNKIDTCKESWFDFYEKGSFYKNEYIARKALLVGIRYAMGYYVKEGKAIEAKFKYTVLSNKLWRLLFLLNRTSPWGVNLYCFFQKRYLAIRWSLKNPFN